MRQVPRVQPWLRGYTKHDVVIWLTRHLGRIVRGFSISIVVPERAETLSEMSNEEQTRQGIAIVCTWLVGIQCSLGMC